MNLGIFLIEQLKLYGSDHIFGIPGDYMLNFMHEVEEHKGIEYVGVSREDCAGYAADAYGRLRGCGAVCVTYSVGAMNIMNSVAGAYAERSPLVVLVGKPSSDDLLVNPNRHHTINDENTQKDIFKNITCNTCSLDSEDMFVNMAMIHLALNQMRVNSRPVYIEFSNKDIVRSVDKYLKKFQMVYGDDIPSKKHPTYVKDTNGIIAKDTPLSKECNSVNLPYEDLDKFKSATDRVLIVGHEVFRHTLEDYILSFAKKLNIPVFTTLLGKSTISEFNRNSIGCVSSLFSDPLVINEIKKSDCIVTIGMINTDIESFDFIADISINMDDGITIKDKHIKTLKATTSSFYELVRSSLVYLGDSVVQSDNCIDKWDNINDGVAATRETMVDFLVNTSPTKLKHVFDTLGTLLTDDHVIISDIGESLFGMIDVPVRKGQFLCMAYYTSMSFSVPAAIGVKYAKPHKRPIVIVGDGAFQMTGSEFSSHIRNDLNSVVIILNNRGYSTEKAIMQGKFNDIHNWRYDKITDLMDGGVGMYIMDSDEFRDAMSTALSDESHSYVLNVEIDPDDQSAAMKNIVQVLCRDRPKLTPLELLLQSPHNATVHQR
ncbi:MAG: alpha-keto acid decarboxylase family protein [Methylococcales bacterium]|jgi:indolepyruvate decarboxylase|nr:alpha-keto acid decarboxylase family protein [Methylococcales bacterium]MBT6251659.1 alpha-keto acid decarboxylase family protein [Nitrosomonadales bacterium]MBT3815034.1 alpha-keto acid decarboxylase family protein [Methylococcales bacterium]MBT4031891.1 alpha-keto acid decarboxylase family protein [Methylococcales bacterium]MBT4599787.1 alpha-keto acid decarboxylase family protein [Methylococcales bacterium]